MHPPNNHVDRVHERLLPVRHLAFILGLCAAACGEVTDYEPYQPLPKFTHVRVDCEFVEGFTLQVAESPETMHVYRGHGEGFLQNPEAFKAVTEQAGRAFAYSFILHVYDDHNRLCRVIAVPRTHLDWSFNFRDPQGFNNMFTTSGIVEKSHKETNDPKLFPDLSLRRHNNIRLYFW
jgi:hypothetical protein